MNCLGLDRRLVLGMHRGPAPLTTYDRKAIVFFYAMWLVASATAAVNVDGPVHDLSLTLQLCVARTIPQFLCQCIRPRESRYANERLGTFAPFRHSVRRSRLSAGNDLIAQE